MVRIETKLGWCVQGRRENIGDNLNILFSTCDEKSLDESLQKFWEIENIDNVKGITASSEIVKTYWDNITYLPEQKKIFSEFVVEK